MSDAQQPSIRVRNLTSGGIEVCFGANCITFECNTPQVQPLPTPYGTALLRSPDAVRNALDELSEGDALVVAQSPREAIDLDQYRYVAEAASARGHELVIQVHHG